MANEDPHGEEGAALATNASVDAVVAALLTIVGMVVMFEARRLGASWTTDGPGPGYFPFYIGAILTIGGLGILYQALLSKNADKGSFVDKEQLGRVLSVLLPSMVYVGAIMVLGQYVASAIFIAVFMVWLGKYSIVKSVLLGVIVNAFFFAMFEVWFKVPLFKGALNPLAFLGY
ncbi:tripartite tricarboxylate transporter TctB family protein [Ramlibacter solisilvae]|uniref:Tripartite tricarboxylate transporter TctB n=1 Tax=Ramlibacter tataouinensis TaxID=94132 RepID=A0A127JT66_9BURK|nr:tripartite tricarboxylate transporter TctB family protein [Ramlibacter tataouinensis]AMO23218.1 tripartite tricarboxylate transporter TctB [Ramlibacter tataouinensis]